MLHRCERKDQALRVDERLLWRCLPRDASASVRAGGAIVATVTSRISVAAAFWPAAIADHCVAIAASFWPAAIADYSVAIAASVGPAAIAGHCLAIIAAVSWPEPVATACVAVATISGGCVAAAVRRG